MSHRHPAVRPTLCTGLLTAGIIALCTAGTDARGDDGVVRIPNQAGLWAPAGHVSFSDQAIHYEIHRASPCDTGHRPIRSYEMPQRHHPVDRWFYVRRLLGLDQPKTPYPRYQYNYGHGVSASRLTPTSRVIR